DINLIQNGLRPEFSKEIPLFYIDLANNCMDATATERPSVSDIQKLLNSWTKENYYVRIFEKADIKSYEYKSENSADLCENSIIKH
ncbi:16439_t:CDS:1, partial [Dentiscutata erythropus]